MAAATAEGTTVLRNAAREPEVQTLARFLRACGARISGDGTPTITVEGVRELSGADCAVPPDRVEAATFLCAAAATRSELSLGPVVPAHLESVVLALRRAGCEVEEADLAAERRRLSGAGASSSSSSSPARDVLGRREASAWAAGETVLRIRPAGRLLAAGVSASPFPGFPTDCQPAWCAVIAAAAPFAYGDGAGGGGGRPLVFPGTPGVEVRDAVFEGRLHHLRQLEAFGLGVVPLDERSAQLWPASAVSCGGSSGSGRLRCASIPHTDSYRLQWKTVPLHACARLMD